MQIIYAMMIGTLKSLGWLEMGIRLRSVIVAKHVEVWKIHMQKLSRVQNL